MPTLVLLRHGKSAYPEGVDDHDRPLDDRGNREAPVAGRRISASLPEFDTVVVSSAARAQETWQHAAPHLRARRVDTSAELYLAEADELLEVVRGLPAASTVAMLVGHNNGLEDLATLLSASDVTLKTSTYAVLTCQDPWTEWAGACANLVEVVVAR